MTSPPYRYVCKWCKKNNWLMPHPNKFKCKYCGKWNKVFVIFPLKWIILKDKKKDLDRKSVV